MEANELRFRIRADVTARAPVDGREADSLARFVEHFDALREPCSETADPVHVTGSAIVIGSRGVLLLKHRRLGIWLQPGGHVDDGETPWDGARREALEETGLAFEFAEVGADGIPLLAHVDVHAGGRGHTHLDLRYVLTGCDDDPCPPAEESQEIGWYGWEEAIALTDDGLRGALRALNPTP